MIPFKVQFDKLTRAYINDEVNPYHSCACFVGNILNNKGEWQNIRRYDSFGESQMGATFQESFVKALNIIKEESAGQYTPDQMIELENLFLRTLEMNTVGEKVDPWCVKGSVITHHNYEEGLFKAFCVTLDKLKEIHISLGEDVEQFSFTKRELQVS